MSVLKTTFFTNMQRILMSNGAMSLNVDISVAGHQDKVHSGSLRAILMGLQWRGCDSWHHTQTLSDDERKRKKEKRPRSGCPLVNLLFRSTTPARGSAHTRPPLHPQPKHIIPPSPTWHPTSSSSLHYYRLVVVSSSSSSAVAVAASQAQLAAAAAFFRWY